MTAHVSDGALGAIKPWHNQTMQDQQRRELLQQIHDSDTRLVISVAGGSLALSDLQTAPGASRTLLEGLAPYTGGAVRSLIGNETKIESHVSDEEARILAEACLARAQEYASAYEDEFPVIGVACTAALATQRERRGADRAWMAVAVADGPTQSRLLEFPASKNHAQTYYERRMSQERELADALLVFIAEHG